MTHPLSRRALGSCLLLLAIAAGCDRTRNATGADRPSSRTGSTTDATEPGLSRAVTVSDLYLPYPGLLKDPVAGGSGRMSLIDLLGTENAVAVADHISLKSPKTELDENEASAFEIFFNEASPSFTPNNKFFEKSRICFQDPASMLVRAIRFAPYETYLPGALADWRAANPQATLDKGIELRFVLQAYCDSPRFAGKKDSGDASVHVIYRLEPAAFRARFAEIEGLVGAALKAGATADTAPVAGGLSAIFDASDYTQWRTRTINAWLSATAGLTEGADAERLTLLSKLPDGFLAAAKKQGFAAVMPRLVAAAFGTEWDPSAPRPDFTISTLGDPSSPAVVEFQATLKSLLASEARLAKVTTFSAIGGENWTFGAMVPDGQGKLSPIEIETVDTALATDANGTRVTLGKTARLGIYENSTELNATSVIARGSLEERLDIALVPRVFSRVAFSKVNAAFLGPKMVRFTGEGMGEHAEHDKNTLAESTADLARVNATNMTCSTCHISVNGGKVTAGAALHMLTEFGTRINARTAAEVKHEMGRLNPTRKE